MDVRGARRTPGASPSPVKTTSPASHGRPSPEPESGIRCGHVVIACCTLISRSAFHTRVLHVASSYRSNAETSALAASVTAAASAFLQQFPKHRYNAQLPSGIPDASPESIRCGS
jgi:hypothetical protein